MTEDSLGVYVMQVASMLTGLHPQTMRKYERAGFLTPSRHYHTRMYSDDDIARLKMIKRMVDDDGLNIAGVSLALKIRDRLIAIKEDLNTSVKDKRLKEQFSGFLDDILEMIESP